MRPSTARPRAAAAVHPPRRPAKIASGIRRYTRSRADRSRRRPPVCISTARSCALAPAIGWTTVTLHVGYGTFKPVRVERVEDHVVDPERYEISREPPPARSRPRASRRRIVAVGTTTTRALESRWRRRRRDASLAGDPAVMALFIRPGHGFAVVDALLTNFHLPRSSLLMLVAAFAGPRTDAGGLPARRRRRLSLLQLRRRDVDNMSAVKFPYEEFDAVRRADVSAGVAPEQGAAPRISRRAWDPATGFEGWSASLPNILAAGDFRAVVAAIGGPRAGVAGIVWGLGAHVIKTGLVARAHRPDGARIRLGDRDQRRRVHPRLRDRAGRRDVRRRGAALGHGQFGMAEETGRGSERASSRRVWRAAWPRAGGAATSIA